MWSPTHVQIIVQRARGLIAKGKSGTNDSYVIIELNKEKFQTSAKEQAIDPVWNEECDLLLEDKNNDIIKLSVFHRNLFGLADEFLGQALISLKDFDVYERPKSRWFKLESKTVKKAVKERGELEVLVKFLVKNVKNESFEKKSNRRLSLLDLRSSFKEHLPMQAEKMRVVNANVNENANGLQPRKRFSVDMSSKQLLKLRSRSISFKIDSIQAKTRNVFQGMTGKMQKISEQSSMKAPNDTKETIETQPKDKSHRDYLQNKLQLMNEEQIAEQSSETKAKATSIKQKANASRKSQSLMKRAFSTSNLFSGKSLPKFDPLEHSSMASLLCKIQSTDTFASLPKSQSTVFDFDCESTLSNKSDAELLCQQTSSSQPFNITEIKLKERAINNFDSLPVITVGEFPFRFKSGEKREAQASPDSLYSSDDSMVTRKMSPSTRPSQLKKYESLTQEELIQLAQTQHMTICRLNDKINELEEYIDNLLVRVLENSPKILQNFNKYSIQL